MSLGVAEKVFMAACSDERSALLAGAVLGVKLKRNL
jgi:hypothetical protein